MIDTVHKVRNGLAQQCPYALLAEIERQIERILSIFGAVHVAASHCKVSHFRQKANIAPGYKSNMREHLPSDDELFSTLTRPVLMGSTSMDSISFKDADSRNHMDCLCEQLYTRIALESLD